VLSFHKIRSFYSFPISRKSEALDGQTDRQGATLNADPYRGPHNYGVRRW